MKNVVLILISFIFLNNSLIKAQEVIVEKNFSGIQWNDEKPPDPEIAAGPNHIVLTVNNKIEIYNKDGGNVIQKTLLSWFSTISPPGDPFDPRVIYDHLNSRWVVFALSRPYGLFSPSNYLISVSQSSDPTASWYYYKFDAKKNNETSTYNHADYTGLGYDGEAIYITSNQIYDYGGFQYAKIKAIKKSDIYNGVSNPANRDFINMHNENGSTVESIQPVHQFGSSSKFYLMNSATGSSANFVTIWSVTDPFGSNPTITRERTIDVGSYHSPDDAVQKNSSTRIETNNARISDCVYRDGFLYGCFHVKNSGNNGSAIKYFKINASDFSLVYNSTIEQTNTWYYYPEIYPDAYGNLLLMFNKSSANDFVGVAWTYRIANQSSIGSISWLKAGEGVYDNLNDDLNRWGDYNGICLDPSNDKLIWIVGEYAKTNNTWGTQVGAFKFNASVPTTFTNKNVNTNFGGSFLVNGSVTVNSGQSTPLFQGNNSAKTNNERFSNWSGTGINYKHNNWNTAASEYFLNHSFITNFGPQQIQDAFFLTMDYAKIEARLEGMFLDGKGNFEFQDPWFIKSDGTQPGNYWRPCVSYYEPTGKEGAVEKGVFLDQSGPTNNWTPPYYSVKAISPQDIPLTQTGKTHRFYFRSWSGTGAQFQNANALETGVVFTSGNAIVNANLKGHLLSDASLAFSGNGQRKLVRDSYGIYHAVYHTSTGIWYTRSATSDFNGTWTADKQVTMYGANPSIDIYGQNVKIVFEYGDGVDAAVFLAEFNYTNFTTASITTIDDQCQASLYPNIYPVVAATQTEVFVLYKKNNTTGLQYKRKYWNNNTQQWIDVPVATLSNTDGASCNPSLASWYTNDAIHMVWQQSDTQIRYMYSYRQSFSRLFSDYAIISSGSGNSYNKFPSISLNTSQLIPLVTWTGSYSTIESKRTAKEDAAGLTQVRVTTRTKASSWGSFYHFGSDVNYSNSASTNSSAARSVISWSQSNGASTKWVKRDNGVYLGIYNYLNTGIIPHMASGNGVSSFADIKSLVFKNTTSPVFYSEKDNTDFSYNPSKKSANGYDLTYGRKGTLYSDLLEFTYNVYDILVDDEVINFISINDTIPFNNLNDLNNALRTKNFQLTENSELFFSDFYKVLNQNSASSILIEGDFVKFSIELVNASDESIIGEFDPVEYSLSNLYEQNTKDYQINCAGIIEGEYYLRLKIDSNVNLSYTMGNEYNDFENLNKKNYQNIELFSEGAITSYDISQNYPNPFNPSTTIRYQIPQDGIVTLKIYDILGREVKTLANEVKTKGRYEVTFDASSLASGLYIYEITSGSYKASKKMTLIK